MVSEYQYYEFIAVDRPLDDDELAAVRALSTRARITPTGFVNSYHWGDFRGNPRTLMERYYDAHLYLANWGTRTVMLRLPGRLLNLATARRYCFGDSMEAWAAGDHVIVAMGSEDSDGGWEDDGEGRLASIIGVRAELASGDLRPLYLAWLAGIGACEPGDLDEYSDDGDDDILEPPVPPGLASLTAPQSALADFLRVDPDLLAVAARASTAAPSFTPSGQRLTSWIAGLPADEKDALLLRFLQGGDPHLRAEVLRRLAEDGSPDRPTLGGRTAAVLLQGRTALSMERERAAEQRRAEERAHREHMLEVAREKRLESLAMEGERPWRRINEMIASRKPAEYDAAAELLTDLSELARRGGRAQEFRTRLAELRRAHERKPSLMERLDRAGLHGVDGALRAPAVARPNEPDRGASAHGVPSAAVMPAEWIGCLRRVLAVRRSARTRRPCRLAPG